MLTELTVTMVSNPVFTEPEKPGNPGFFQNRKTGFWLPVNPVFLTLLLTLCGITSQKTHRGGLGLGGSVHEEARLCFPYLVQPSFKGTDAGSIYYPLVQLIPSINHSV